MANQGKKIEKVMRDAIAKLDSVQTVLTKIPNIEDSTASYVQSEANRLLGKLAPSPTKFLEEVITHLLGKTGVIDVVGSLLELGLPAIELAVKSALIYNMSELGVDCNIDPLITDKFLREGVMFDLKEIDLYDKLRVSPLDPEIGQYFYFGCEDCVTPAEVRMSALSPEAIVGGKFMMFNHSSVSGNGLYGWKEKKGDFDALLWYMAHQSKGREVWFKKTPETEYEIVEQIKKRRGYVGEENGKIIYDKDKKNKDKKYRKKYKKTDGILTLEFSPRSGNVKQSNGNAMAQQVPYDNVLHVFLGNCKQLQKSKEASDNAKYLDNLSSLLTQVNQVYNRMAELRQTCEEKLAKIEDDVEGAVASNVDNALNVKKEQKLIYTRMNRILDMQLGRGGAKIDPRFYMTNGKIDLEGKVAKIKSIIQTFYDIYCEQKLLGKGNSDDIYNVVRSKEKTITQLVYQGYNLNNKLFVGSEDATKPVFDEEGNPYLYVETETNQHSAQQPNGEGWTYLLHLTHANPKYRLTISGIRDIMLEIVQAQETIVAMQSQTSNEYPKDPKWNHYFRHVLTEWNYDYIMSLTLFDGKVLTARLINTLFGSVSMDIAYGLSLSWKQQLIQNEVKKILSQIMANPDDATVDDCFFTFSNNQERDMLHKMELQRAGIPTMNGEVSKIQGGCEQALSKLGELSYVGTPEGRKEVIKGALLSVTGETSQQVYDSDNGSFDASFTDANINISFIENLLTNLTTEIVMSILSPKVYLCILVNLKLMGMSTEFNLTAFLNNFSSLILKIVKQVYDEVSGYILDYIGRKIDELFSAFSVQIALEQAETYARLLRQIFNHFKQLLSMFNQDSTPWNVDRVDSADIQAEDNSETEKNNATC